MSDPEMTPLETRLASRLRAYSAIEVPGGNALALARTAMATKPRSGLRAAWLGLGSPVRAAIVLALVSSLVVGALLIGAQLLRDDPTVVLPEPSRPGATAAVPVGPATEDLRARWLANVEEIPSLRNGAGPVTLTIDPAGARLSLANLAAGASFASLTSVLDSGALQLELVADGAGCAAGSVGVYRLEQTSTGAQMTLSAVTDDCANRRLALSRTWDRTLVAPTSLGAGMVDSFEPYFAVALPPGKYEARLLTDFIDITATDTDFGMDVFKNPQGFADACSQDEVRYPYTSGAAAFVDFFRQNDAFIVEEATPLTIDGHSAIHLVLKPRVDGARCPGVELMGFTPKDCECHFFAGDDNFYVVDVGEDTFLFQLPATTDYSIDLPIIESIRIPYVPGAPGP